MSQPKLTVDDRKLIEVAIRSFYGKSCEWWVFSLDAMDETAYEITMESIERAKLECDLAISFLRSFGIRPKGL